MIVRFVDISGIADHHYLNFLFIMEHGKAQYIVLTISFSYKGPDQYNDINNV